MFSRICDRVRVCVLISPNRHAMPYLIELGRPRRRSLVKLLFKFLTLYVCSFALENVTINNAHVKEIIINQSMHTTIHVQQFIEQVNFCCSVCIARNHPYTIRIINTSFVIPCITQITAIHHQASYSSNAECILQLWQLCKLVCGALGLEKAQSSLSQN